MSTSSTTTQSRTRATFLGDPSVLDTQRQTLGVHPPAGGHIPGDALFVSSPTSNVVNVYDADSKGGSISPFAIFADSHLNQPDAVALDGDYLYAGNLGDTPAPSYHPTGNGSVSIFDTRSPANPAIATLNGPSSKITSVNALAVGGDDLFVANGYPNGDIVVFAEHGLNGSSVPLSTFALPTGSGAQPTGVAVNGDRLYVVDFFSNQVFVYNISGHWNTLTGPPLVATIAAPGTVSSISNDAAGGDSLYIDACCSPIGILIYDKNANGSASETTVSAGFDQATGFATGLAFKGDKVWAIDAGPGNLLEFQKKGQSLGSPLVFSTGLSAIGGNYAQLAGIALK